MLAHRRIAPTRRRPPGRSRSDDPVPEHDDLVRPGDREEVRAAGEPRLEGRVGRRPGLVGARRRAPPTSSSSRAGSWSPMTFAPPVRVWLEARSGYRSGSWPIAMSTTAASKSPVRRWSVARIAGSARRPSTVNPSAVQSAAIWLPGGEEDRVHRPVGDEQLDRPRAPSPRSDASRPWPSSSRRPSEPSAAAFRSRSTVGLAAASNAHDEGGIEPVGTGREPAIRDPSRSARGRSPRAAPRASADRRTRARSGGG